jgi:hypothetical protein
VERLADGDLEFRDPRGRVVPQVPPPPTLTGDSEALLHAENAAAGVHLDAHTLTPNWGGERLNLGWAIDVMHPRAIGH